MSFSGNLSCSASSRVHRLRLAALFCGVVSRLSALDMCWQPSLCLMLFKGLQPSRKVESGSVGPGTSNLIAFCFAVLFSLGADV